jgi:hypothetical protein
LKTDLLGRVKMPKERREALLDEFEKSGMTGHAFSRWAGIKYQTFATWRQQRRKKLGLGKPRRRKEGKSVEWLEATAPVMSSFGGKVVVQFSGGIRIETHDGKTALEILRGLGVKGC